MNDEAGDNTAKYMSMDASADPMFLGGWAKRKERML